MEKRTAEIIMVCKGRHLFGYQYNSLREVVIAYLSDRCAVEKQFYTPDIVSRIALDAFCDYVNSAEKPGFVAKLLIHSRDLMISCGVALNRNYNPNEDPWLETDTIFAMFQLVEVCNDGEYINGFTEDNTKFVVPTTKSRRFV